MDVTVVSVACRDNGDIDRVLSSATPPPDVGHNWGRCRCPCVIDKVPGLKEKLVEAEIVSDQFRLTLVAQIC